MNAEEIRKLNEVCQKKCLDTMTVSEQKAGLESVKLSILTEIAAQLAEANESLRKISNPLMMLDTESPWVWLTIADGMQQVFDRNKIVSVTWRGDNLTVINDNWNQDHAIFMPIKDVCRKLRIPMEGNQ